MHCLSSKRKGKDQESIQSSTTNGKVTKSQLDITNISPFPAGDHKSTFKNSVYAWNHLKLNVTLYLSKQVWLW